MEIYLEKAKSSKTKCQKCKKSIIKNEDRLITEEMSYFGHPAKTYYCISCSKPIIQSKISELEDILKKVKQ